MELKHWKLNVDADHVAWLYFDRAGSTTNTFSKEALRELGQIADHLQSMPPKALAVLSAKGSLYATRPTLVTYTATRAALLAMAAEMFELVKAGKIVSEARQTYPLKDVAQAHRDLEARKTTGSTLLLP